MQVCQVRTQKMVLVLIVLILIRVHRQVKQHQLNPDRVIHQVIPDQNQHHHNIIQVHDQTRVVRLHRSDMLQHQNLQKLVTQIPHGVVQPVTELILKGLLREPHQGVLVIQVLGLHQVVDRIILVLLDHQVQVVILPHVVHHQVPDRVVHQEVVVEAVEDKLTKF